MTPSRSRGGDSVRGVDIPVVIREPDILRGCGSERFSLRLWELGSDELDDAIASPKIIGEPVEDGAQGNAILFDFRICSHKLSGGLTHRAADGFGPHRLGP